MFPAVAVLILGSCALAELGVDGVHAALQRLLERALVVAPGVQRVHEPINLFSRGEHAPRAVRFLHVHHALHPADPPPVRAVVAVLPEAPRAHGNRGVLVHALRLFLPRLLLLALLLGFRLEPLRLLRLFSAQALHALLLLLLAQLRALALVVLALVDCQLVGHLVELGAPCHERLAVLGVALVLSQVLRELEIRLGRGLARLARGSRGFLLRLRRLLLLLLLLVVVHGGPFVVVVAGAGSVAVARVVVLVVLVLVFVLVLVLHLLPGSHRGFASLALLLLLRLALGGGFRADRLALLLGLVLDGAAALRLGVVLEDARVAQRLRLLKALGDDGARLVRAEREVSQAAEREHVLGGAQVLPRRARERLRARAAHLLALEHAPRNLRPRRVREHAAPLQRVAPLADDRLLHAGLEQRSVERAQVVSVRSAEHRAHARGGAHALWRLERVAKDAEEVGERGFVGEERRVRDGRRRRQRLVPERLHGDVLRPRFLFELRRELDVGNGVFCQPLLVLDGVLLLLRKRHALGFACRRARPLLLVLSAVALRLLRLALRLTRLLGLALLALLRRLALHRGLRLVQLSALHPRELLVQRGERHGVLGVQLLARQLRLQGQRLLQLLAALLDRLELLLRSHNARVGFFHEVQALGDLRERLLQRLRAFRRLSLERLLALRHVRVALAVHAVLEFFHILLPRHELVPVPGVPLVRDQVRGEPVVRARRLLQDIGGGFDRRARRRRRDAFV